jgi:hypothetical protein
VAFGILAFSPIWVAAMCACFLGRRGWLMWILCLAATAALAALVPGRRLLAGLAGLRREAPSASRYSSPDTLR